MESWLGPILLLLVITHGTISYLFQWKAPDVYMDEIFHERQTKIYCRGQSDVWDDKITTPPGLYVVGTAVLWISEAIKRSFQPTSPPLWAQDANILAFLRPINCAFNLASFVLLYRIFHQQKKLTLKEALLHALGLLLYPIIFFFGFLYYTDAGGLFCILAMYYLARNGKHFWAACMGGCSLFFRQTNVVWIAYILGTSIVRDMHHRAVAVAKKEEGAHGIITALLADEKAPFSPHLLLDFIIYMLSSWYHLLGLFWPYLLPIIAFVGFMIWNEGSIVLGDKSHHQMVFHLAQIAYVLFLTAHLHQPLLSITPSSWQAFATYIKTRLGWPQFLLLMGGIGYLVDRYTLSHPFLLADNRHYTFYLWRRLYQRLPHANLFLVPFYALSAWWIADGFKKANRGSSSLSFLILTIAVCLVLLPAHLLEPRYFTIPVIITLLELPQRSPLSLTLTSLAFVWINLITIYVFLWRPFAWADGSIARFMW